MKNSNPQPIYLKDYQVPDYLIDKIELDVKLDEDATIVTSHMFVKKNPRVKPLRLTWFCVGKR